MGTGSIAACILKLGTGFSCDYFIAQATLILVKEPPDIIG
jgi:hypothetical protein